MGACLRYMVVIGLIALPQCYGSRRNATLSKYTAYFLEKPENECTHGGGHGWGHAERKVTVYFDDQGKVSRYHHLQKSGYIDAKLMLAYITFETTVDTIPKQWEIVRKATAWI